MARQLVVLQGRQPAVKRGDASMSKAVRVIIIQTIIWSLVAVVLVVVLALPGTIDHWGDNTLKTILLGVLVFLGYGSDAVFQILSRSKRWGYQKDERDQHINTKAVNTGMIALILYVYVFSITLYIVYENLGVIPVGWMWILAYSAIVEANLSIRLASLLLYKKHGY